MQQQEDKRRGSAKERGYDYKWYRYSQWFLKQPGNQFCAYRLPGCTMLAKCVDHQYPPNGPDDPLFWNKKNHKSACVHCNSVKGHKYLKTFSELQKPS
jgi:5-methylcytosine-specific restriction protein A